jgi:hypothetical protein
MSKKRSLLVRRAPLVALAIPCCVFAQFGIPQLVYDPAAVTQIIAEVRQVIQLYNVATQTYNQIAYSAGWTPVRTPWLGVATPIVLSQTATIFGETAPWNPAVTTGIGIQPAWQTATYAINPPPFWAGYPLGNSTVSANIASINVADGTSQAAMQTIANSRTNQPINDLALANLEMSAQDTSDATNSEVEQLNQIASSTVLSNRQAEDTNALLTTVAEQQIVLNKIQRDSLASSLNVQAKRDLTYETEPTGIGSFAALFGQ